MVQEFFLLGGGRGGGEGGVGCASFPGSHKPKKEAKIGFRSQLYNLRSDQRKPRLTVSFETKRGSFRKLWGTLFGGPYNNSMVRHGTACQSL